MQDLELKAGSGERMLQSVSCRAAGGDGRPVTGNQS